MRCCQCGGVQIDQAENCFSAYPVQAEEWRAASQVQVSWDNFLAFPSSRAQGRSWPIAAQAPTWRALVIMLRGHLWGWAGSLTTA